MTVTAPWWRRYPRQALDLVAFVALGLLIVWQVIRSYDEALDREEAAHPYLRTVRDLNVNPWESTEPADWGRR